MPIERDPIALAIAGYAAVVSTAVFAWTVYSYKKDSPRVVLSAKILVDKQERSGQVIQNSYALDEFYPNSETGSEWKLEIHFANAGRRPVTITGWAAIRTSKFDYPPSETFYNPVTLQESETSLFYLQNFDVFRKNTSRVVVKDSQGRSWSLPTKQVKQIQKLMLDHKL
ncbi:hypothetical protein [Terriglobus sp. TAA 43]|uniref:hypothetical protein n=1 Tax=Terriglobus sp. TAA 43 TaxID=278961 RepID=UPI0006476C76|nr:hypothetical protein [Terriglobus sp. TAA 43]